MRSSLHLIVRTLGYLCLCSALPALAAPWTPENAPWNVNLNQDGSAPERYYGGWEGHTYHPSPVDWRKLAIYHVMLDRFSDGDPRNNDGTYGGFDPGRLDFRQGGDFVGLTNKLDYIKSLGFNAILLSPIFQNLENDYHGYGQIDFTLLDNRFGTLEEFRTLVREAHRRGMYIIADIVVNHLSYLLINEGHADKPAPFVFHKDEYQMFPRWPGREYTDFRPNNTFVPDAAYCDVYGRDGNRYQDSMGKGSYALSDFNHNGDLISYDDPWQINLGQIYGRYNDLRLCSEQVQQKIIAMTKALIASTDIDAIRIDTPMQVPLGFFKTWTPAVKAFAKSLGKENFLMFGELYVQRPRAATMIGRGKTPDQYGKPEAFISDTVAMDSGIHYGFYKGLIVPLLVDNRLMEPKGFAELLKQDFETYDHVDSATGSLSYRMVNFFDNHDQRRLTTAPHGIEKTKLASALLAFWPGIPMFYYGDEQALCSYGSALDGHARESMMSSFAWSEHPACRSPNPANGDNFDMSSEMYLHLQRIYQTRRAMADILVDDKPQFLLEEVRNGSPVVVFSRSSPSEDQRAVVALNFGGSESGVLQLELDAAAKGRLFKNMLRDEPAVRANDKGMLQITLAPFEAKVLVLEEQAPQLPLAIIAASPSHDSIIPAGKHTLTLQFSYPIRGRDVTRAIRWNGKELDPKSIAFTASRTTAQITVAVEPGINELILTPEGALSELPAVYRLRLRAGAVDNVLVRGFSFYNPRLVNNGDLTTTSHVVTLSHSAVGARYFRVLNQGQDRWSAWEPYTPESRWEFPYSLGLKKITVQYWIDGSAAYFVSGAIDLVGSDGVTSENT